MDIWEIYELEQDLRLQTKKEKDIINDLNMMSKEDFEELVESYVWRSSISRSAIHKNYGLLSNYIDNCNIYFSYLGPQTYSFNIKDNDIICNVAVKYQINTDKDVIMFGYLDFIVSRGTFKLVYDDFYTFTKNYHTITLDQYKFILKMFINVLLKMADIPNNYNIKTVFTL